jgi:capsular polysaccharide biosynthesis protein
MTAQTPVPASVPPTPEISLVEAVWRFRTMSLIIVLVSVLLSSAVTLLLGGATATARFAVTDPTNKNNVLRMGVVSGQGFATYTAQRAAFAGSTPVLTKATEIIKRKGGPTMTSAQLRGRVSTSSKADGGVVLVEAKGSDMREAAMIANAVVAAYQEVTVATNIAKLDEQLKTIQQTQQQVTQQMEATTVGSRNYRLLANRLTKLQADESGVLSARANTNDGVQFVDTADPSAAEPSKLPRNAAIGFAVGLIAACVVSFLRAASPNARRRMQPAAAGGPPDPGEQAAAPPAAPEPSRPRRGRSAPADPAPERSGPPWSADDAPKGPMPPLPQNGRGELNGSRNGRPVGGRGDGRRPARPGRHGTQGSDTGRPPPRDASPAGGRMSRNGASAPSASSSRRKPGDGDPSRTAEDKFSLDDLAKDARPRKNESTLMRYDLDR